MIIGIDLDNTIINYGDLFYKAATHQGWELGGCTSKSDIKSYLLLQDNNDERWQLLQALVYSEFILQAKIFPHVLEFCEISIRRGYQLYIISHKTKVSNFDGTKNLIIPALACLEHNKLIGLEGLLKREGIYFCATREEKINKIKHLKCDIFIDDLLDVLNEPSFPENTLKLCFDLEEKTKHSITQIRHINSWKQLVNLLHIGDDIWFYVLRMLKSVPLSVEKCLSGGNHPAFVIDDKYFIKTQFNNKLIHEYEALQLLQTNRVFCVPKAISISADGNCLILEKINGTVVREFTPEVWGQVIDFIVMLSQINGKFYDASQRRRRLNEYLSAIDKREKVISLGIASLKQQYPGLLKVQSLLQQFTLLKSYCLNKFYSEIKRANISLDEEFSEQECILNPSDFGLHNMLTTANNKLIFVDFEYFGWDDKVKMIADFIHHPANHLNKEQIKLFIALLTDKNLLINELITRLRLVIDLIGLEWVLIILNIAQQDKLEQKKMAFYPVTVDKIINQQVLKAQNLLAFYQQNYVLGKDFITLGMTEKELFGDNNG